MRTCSILRVNDDPQVIASVHELRATMRHRWIVGPTTKEAMSALIGERCGFDLLLADLAGGLTGFALFEALKRGCARLPAVALTPPDERLVSEEAFLRGGVALLDKPGQPAELAEAVQAACGCGSRQWSRRTLLPARRLAHPKRRIRR